MIAIPRQSLQSGPGGNLVSCGRTCRSRSRSRLRQPSTRLHVQHEGDHAAIAGRAFQHQRATRRRLKVRRDDRAVLSGATIDLSMFVKAVPPGGSWSELCRTAGNPMRSARGFEARRAMATRSTFALMEGSTVPLSCRIFARTTLAGANQATLDISDMSSTLWRRWDIGCAQWVMAGRLESRSDDPQVDAGGGADCVERGRPRIGWPGREDRHQMPPAAGGSVHLDVARARKSRRPRARHATPSSRSLTFECPLRPNRQRIAIAQAHLMA